MTAANNYFYEVYLSFEDGNQDLHWKRDKKKKYALIISCFILHFKHVGVQNN